MPTQVYIILELWVGRAYYEYAPPKLLLLEKCMNARQRCRLRRQIRYRKKCQQDDEIRQVRLNAIEKREKETRSIENIIDNIFGLKPKLRRRDDNINVWVEFVTLMKADNTAQTASFTNRCLPNVYLYKP
ncbi:hypothetical protein Rin_00004390 [Candidatus Regiella insecticola 5.15]|uniref:Uncharacterized protein n=1 Tax=Candidatus Regiella insecticola 5.15 TaxID=1005043 RepID=G2GXE7_9ENTR|nr:hypothetical protein [Candidatus Regiella insecticola]EGY29580.1 hypothetical protein Rin_00004390 [Candidatus Regiella insecticola 5.15]